MFNRVLKFHSFLDCRTKCHYYLIKDLDLLVTKPKDIKWGRHWKLWTWHIAGKVRWKVAVVQGTEGGNVSKHLTCKILLCVAAKTRILLVRGTHPKIRSMDQCLGDTRGVSHHSISCSHPAKPSEPHLWSYIRYFSSLTVNGWPSETERRLKHKII